MKKLTVLAALLLAVSAGTTAFATTEYDPKEQSVKNTNQGSYQTVLITKGGASDEVTAGNIVYVDQAAANKKFQVATKFLLKYNSNDGTSVKDGVYTIRFGGEQGSATAQFAVGVGIEGYDTKLEPEGEPVVDANGNYSHGFVTSEGVALKEADTILVKIGNKVMAYPIRNTGITFTEATVMFGIQIDDVETNAENSVEVYLRQVGTVE